MNTRDRERKLLKLDSRRRCSFGRIGKPEHRFYQVTEYPDGSLLLVPVEIVPVGVGDA